MAHDESFDLDTMFTPEFWDERYGGAERIWSGNVNPHLAEVAGELAAGSALDVGCGEGADAIWLASRGWAVTAVDISTVALARAAAQAAEAGPAIAARVTWDQADVLSWDPAPARFDLVSVHFIHLRPEALRALHARLAAAVTPGGTLLIVGHHPSDPGRPQHHLELMFTAERIAEELDPTDWATVVATAPERQAVDGDGQTITVHDAVLRAVRRG